MSLTALYRLKGLLGPATKACNVTAKILCCPAGPIASQAVQAPMHSINSSGICISFKHSPLRRVSFAHDNAEVRFVTTVDLTRQLLQDVHMHVRFDLLAVTGCYKLHRLHSTMLIGQS